MRLGFACALAVLFAAVACTNAGTQTTAFSVGGVVSGLFGTVVVADNANDQLSISSDGNFTFGSFVNQGGAYSVTVVKQPAGQTCVVENGSGTISGANVTTVQVNCNVGTTALFSIGGTVSNLPAGGTLLLDNGADQVSITNSGTFVFPKQVPAGTRYDVTVDTNPTGYACSVNNGVGSVVSASITNVSVTCAFVPVYSVGGTITGATGSLQLTAGFGNPLTVSSGTTFSFPGVPTNTTYDIEVGTPPPGQNCVVSGGTGTVGSSNITNIAITCTNITYTISGNVTGSTGGLTVTLNGDTQNAQTIASLGSFSFAGNANGLNYTIAVSVPPTGQTCTVTNGTGIIEAANVTNVAIACIPYVVSGTFPGDANGMILSVNDNGNTTNYIYNGNTTSFAIPGFIGGDTYDIEVLESTPGQLCTFSGTHSGTITGDVSGLSLTCTPKYYTIAGLLYTTSGTATISNGTSQVTNISGNAAAWSFNSLPDGMAITLTATPSTPGLTCTVEPINASFTIQSQNTVGIVINCS